jgi:hypothetical protein
VGAASSRDLRSKIQLPQKNTTSLEVELKCPTLCVITHGIPQKPSVFSLRSIYLSSYNKKTVTGGGPGLGVARLGGYGLPPGV